MIELGLGSGVTVSEVYAPPGWWDELGACRMNRQSRGVGFGPEVRN
jgi:hypothetical protein